MREQDIFINSDISQLLTLIYFNIANYRNLMHSQLTYLAQIFKFVKLPGDLSKALISVSKSGEPSAGDGQAHSILDPSPVIHNLGITSLDPSRNFIPTKDFNLLMDVIVINLKESNSNPSLMSKAG